MLDRGFAGRPWLKPVTGNRLRFILRLPTRYHLTDVLGTRAAWQIIRGWDFLTLKRAHAFRGPQAVYDWKEGRYLRLSSNPIVSMTTLPCGRLGKPSWA